MKIGLGLYRHMLTSENFQFARQANCTHIVAHYVDYFKNRRDGDDIYDQPAGDLNGWGEAGDPNTLWSEEELVNLRKSVEAEGLKLAAIENFDPSHWYDVLLDGPKRDEQIENLKTIVRNVGAAGIPVIGYNFSLAGVASRERGAFARGGAISIGMNYGEDTPIPNGMVWNMIYDQNAPKGTIPVISHEELWNRLDRFLADILPVAEAAGVQLAAHPDDPPLPTLRGTPRLVYQPHMYRQVLRMRPSPSNTLEFCLGTISEMTDGDVYESVDEFSSLNKIAYIHFRNVKGKVPTYKEVFIDEGDIDMVRVLQILKKNHYQGVLIPDHTPLMSCSAPWHAGMAFALGYIQAALENI